MCKDGKAMWEDEEGSSVGGDSTVEEGGVSRGDEGGVSRGDEGGVSRGE